MITLESLAIMNFLRQEIRYSARSIRNAPLLSLVVISTLAVGIALVTTFFSLVNSAFLHPLPYRKADRIVTVAQYYVYKLPLDELRRMTTALSGLATFEPSQAIVGGAGPAMSASTALVDTAFFRLLGESPILGSLPTAREIAAKERLVVINETLWRGYFGGRTDIIGSTAMLDDLPYRVVGVMPAWFTFPGRSLAWIPFDAEPGPNDRWLLAIGELGSGKTFDDVQREIELLGKRLHAIDSSRYHLGRTGGLVARSEMLSRGRDVPFYRSMAALVVGGALSVLLIGCTNVAALMFARAARRRGEMVIRASLGASRWQLIRPQLVESTMLALLAGIAGTTLSIWGVHIALGLLPPMSRNVMPGWVSFGVDARVLAFAGTASLLTVLIFGLWPAREGTRFDLTGALRGTANHGVAGRDPMRRLHLPVVLELMFSLALFIAAVLALQSFRAAAAADRGFLMTDRYQVRTAFDSRRDSTHEAYTRYVTTLRDRIAAAAPGTEVALATMYSQFHGDTAASAGLIVPETRQQLSWEFFGRVPELVSDNYFQVLGMRMIAGRPFNASDVASSEPVVIVSRRFATDVWGTTNPLGRQIGMTKGGSIRATVVGVVSNVTSQDRTGEGAFTATRDVYLSERQGLTCCNRATFILHSTLPPPAIASLIGAQLKGMGRDLPVTVRTLHDAEATEWEVIGQILSPVLGTIAIAGLFLAILGIYGVVAFAVERRVREIGVRIALGATQGDVVRHLMLEGLQLVGLGTAFGLATAWGISRLMSTFIMGSTATHVSTALGVAAVFAIIALMACYIPARRSSRLDPIAALRSP